MEHPTKTVPAFQPEESFRFLLYMERKCLFPIYVIGYVNLLNETKYQLNTGDSIPLKMFLWSHKGQDN